MLLTNEDINELSDMLRIDLTDEEGVKLVNDLNLLIEFIEGMNELDTDNEEPMSYVHSISNVYRDDLVVDSKSKQELHGNAHERIDDYYVVPRIME